MAYVMVGVVLVAIAGLVARAVLTAQRGRRDVAAGPDGADVTSRRADMPPNPSRSVPGSATHRHQQGKP